MGVWSVMVKADLAAKHGLKRSDWEYCQLGLTTVLLYTRESGHWSAILPQTSLRCPCTYEPGYRSPFSPCDDASQRPQLYPTCEGKV